MVYIRKVLPIKIIKILKGLKNTFLYNIVMFVLVYCINYINILDTAKIFIQLIVGFISYIGIAYVCKDKNFNSCQVIMKQILSK